MSAPSFRSVRWRRGLPLGGAALLSLAFVLAAATAVAQPDPYDDPPTPAKPAPPKAQPPKAPARPAPPKAQPPKAPAKPAAPKAEPPTVPSKRPTAPAVKGEPLRRPDGRRPGMRRPSPGRMPPGFGPPRGKRGPGHGKPGHGKPGHGKPGSHGADAHGDDAHGGKHATHCPGHGPKDRPAAINLVHGWLGVSNDWSEPMPNGVKAGGLPWKNWDWWSWRLTPYPFRYENEKNPCDVRNEPTPLLAPVLNFAVLAFILFRLGRKPLREALKKRKSTIMKEIDDARDIKEKAQDRLERYETDLDHLDEKLAALRDQYAAEAADEKKSVVKDSEEARDRMMADAEFRVQQEGRVARDVLSARAMAEALAAAETLLEERVSKADHDRLAEEFLEQIGPALTKHGMAADQADKGDRP